MDPAMDFMNAIGTNTHTVVSVDAITATKISVVPLYAASFGSMPSLILSDMFSRTMIEFVTSRPTALDSAISDMMLMVNPAKYMNVNAPTTEIGIVTAAMNIELNLPRKSSSTIAVSTIAISIFVITLSRDS